MDEIEAGLYSMDALAAILMPGFKESNWTDQEVGIAVGRGTLVIPIMRGLEPYGFISKYQGLNATGKTVAAVAEEIFRILTSSPKTRAKMLSCLTETTLQAKSEVEVLEKLGFLASVKALPKGNLQQLQEAAANSVVLMAAKPLEKLNELLASHKLSPVFFKKSVFDFDDDIPF